MAYVIIEISLFLEKPKLVVMYNYKPTKYYVTAARFSNDRKIYPILA